MALFSTQASAAEGDMKLGIWQGFFCGAPADFELYTTKSDDKWFFEGKILIRDTGEYDRLTIEQYDDNSLRVRRYLSGSHAGKRQWAKTAPPKITRKNGGVIAEFEAKSGNGVGCNNEYAYTRFKVYY